MDENTNPTTASTEAHDASASEAQEALHVLVQQGLELYAYLAHFVRAQIDVLKLSGRQIILWAAVGSLAAVLVVSALVMGVVLLLSGLATGVGTAVGGALWLGQIIVGLGFLILFGIVILLGWSRMQRRSRRQKVQDYAKRQHQQRLHFGHSVAERANHSAL
jgi:membrane protein implicated in regulation of membrane protease activity